MHSEMELERELKMEDRIASHGQMILPHRARRQFDAVEPENRLVASELEARWNRALAQVSGI